MSGTQVETYVGEIRPFAGPFIPSGWAACEGQLLTIADNQVLFAVIGNRYGGDARITFALPDLRGLIPLGMGTGVGLIPRTLGSQVGVSTVVLTADQMPSHNHAFYACSEQASTPSPQAAAPAVPAADASYAGFYTTGDPSFVTVQLDPAALAPEGMNQAHSNVMPTMVLHYIIALSGTFPVHS